jgi:predicted nucleotidyltransferase
MRLAKEYRPQRIVLFGSYARGKARPDSDVDLLVVIPLQGSGVVKGAEMLRKLRPSFSVDLIVRSPEDLARRLRLKDFFLLEATQEGKLLYEASDA